MTVPFLGWATEFIDYDNDGWKDLFIANGHVYPAVDQNNWGSTYAERPLLFHNQLGKKLSAGAGGGGIWDGVGDPSARSGFRRLIQRWPDGRGVINNMDSVPALLRNVDADHHHWVELSLVGGPKSPKRRGGAQWFI